LHLNPHNIKIMAEVVAKRLIASDPNNALNYRRNLDNFTVRWQKNIRKWEKRAAALKGKSYIPHHRNWSYLADWLGMNELIAIEPKPSVSPTIKHLETVLNLSRVKQPSFIIRTPYANSDGAVWLAEKSGIKSLVLPYTVGGNKKSSNLFELFDNTLDLLLGAI